MRPGNEAKATGSPTEPEAQATGSPTEPEAQATGSHTEPEANAADSESQTSTETAIDFEENDSEEEADPENREITETTTHNKKLPQYFELYLHGKKLRRISVLSMVMLAAGVLGTTFVTLWTTLLTRESITCGEVGFDCFANDEPVTDCSMFENGTIVHINGTRYELACFRFVFDYVRGFSAAGGFTFSAMIVINVILLAIISISKIKSRICHVLSMLLFSFFLIITVLGFSFVSLFPVLRIDNIFLRFSYLFSFYFWSGECMLLAIDVWDVHVQILSCLLYCTTGIKY